jgi:hypothetical protein
MELHKRQHGGPPRHSRLVEWQPSLIFRALNQVKYRFIGEGFVDSLRVIAFNSVK